MSLQGPVWTRSRDRGLRFQPVRPQDRSFLHELYASTRHAELQAVPWSDAEKASFLAMQFEAQHSEYQAHYSGADFWLIVDGGEPIGRLYLDRRADEHRLIDIALVPERRGEGLGRALIEDVLEEAERAGKPVRIHVEHFNPALRLYGKLGFRTVEDTGVYLFMEWCQRR